MMPLGFASGLPLALSGGTLQAWLTTSGIDVKAIGLFSLVGLPYTLKFLWSPLVDRFVPPFLGRRRGWILLFQASLALVLGFMAILSPEHHLYLLGIAALLLAFFSASQDIVIDAYRTDLLTPIERGFGAGVHVTAYRMAMIVSGAMALILGEKIGWGTTYLVMALIMGTLTLTTPILPEPEGAYSPVNLRSAVLQPFLDFVRRPRWLAFLFLIVFYKLGDAFCGSLTTCFLIRGAGFTPTDVGVINKGLGLGATILGAVGGGALMARLGLFNSLLYFGILQALSNLAFMVLALAGKDYGLMVLAVAVENVSGGMGTAAFVAFLMSLCNRRHSATQYALLSALASLGRVFIGPPAGLLVAHTSWSVFFFISFLAAMPGLAILMQLRPHIRHSQ